MTATSIGLLPIVGMIFSVLASIGVPIAALIFFQRRFKTSINTIFIGMAGFVLFVLILEGLMHTFFLRANVASANFFNENPLAYALYGSFAAGIFEETARLLAYLFIIKTTRDWADGVGYGVGHGGIEAVMVAGLASINNLVASVMINSGSIKPDAAAGVTAEQISAQINVANDSTAMFFIGGFERIFALAVQIGLSLVVLYAVKQKKLRFFFLAILLHAALNLPAGFFQRGIGNIWLVELWALLFAVASVVWIWKSYKIFAAPKVLGEDGIPIQNDSNKKWAF